MTGSEEYMGVISLFAGNFTPHGYLRCDGQALSSHAYPVLFSLIGNAFGGDRSTFHLPNLNSSLPFPGGREPAYVMCIDGRHAGPADEALRTYLIGTVVLFAGLQALPRDLLECDGRELSVRAHEPLYHLIGTRFGGGGGFRGTFALPKLNDPPPFPAAPGVKYYIAVDGFFPTRH